jgi:hypothetical protein
VNTLSIDCNAFSLGEDHHLSVYKPSPASEHLPEWFKGLGKLDLNFKSAHSCRGLYDAMTVGFMVVWPLDVVIRKDENNKMYISSLVKDDREWFHAHPAEQLGLYPDANLSFQKFGVEKVGLPYRIKTNAKTSLWMIQPPYRPDLKTEVMPGVIDTDKFYSPLNVLFTMKQYEGNREIKIAAGTPLAQIIPFVRSEWEIEYHSTDSNLLQVTDDNTFHLDKHYQKKLWTRKVFKRKKER